jgi:hypothetical protein
MSWLSQLLPSLATLSTTDPTLAATIFNSFSSKKTVASAVQAQLHSLTMVTMANAQKGLANIGTTVSAIDALPNVSTLNIADQVNELETATDGPSLLKMISDLETALNQVT